MGLISRHDHLWFLVPVISVWGVVQANVLGVLGGQGLLHTSRGERGGGLHKELQLTANVMLICMGSQSAMSFDGIALKALR